MTFCQGISKCPACGHLSHTKHPSASLLLNPHGVPVTAYGGRHDEMCVGPVSHGHRRHRVCAQPSDDGHRQERPTHRVHPHPAHRPRGRRPHEQSQVGHAEHIRKTFIHVSDRENRDTANGILYQGKHRNLEFVFAEVSAFHA